MRYLFILLAIFLSVKAAANDKQQDSETITIPFMAVEAGHRAYSSQLLQLALELSQQEYGPYLLQQHKSPTVIRRQLKELELNRLSVAVAMPTPKWLDKALPVRFPLLKGVASYRLFFSLQNYQKLIEQAVEKQQWSSIYFGQGKGWSTGHILEHNGYKVIYGGPYASLFPMLKANRFQLLMRGVYEVEAELPEYRQSMPELTLVDNMAFFTYLPMYFFVSKERPELAQRIQYGLTKAYENGRLDELFNLYFGSSVELIRAKSRRLFYLENPNIDESFFQQDRPYLLKEIVGLQRRDEKAL